MLCSFGTPTSLFCKITGSVRSEGRIGVDSLGMPMATQFGQVVYTSSIVMACYATDLRRRNGFRVEGTGFADPSVLSLDMPRDPTAYGIRWSALRIVKSWDQLSNSVTVRNLEELVQPFVVFRRPWACFRVFSNEGWEFFVGQNESALSNLERSTTQNIKESFTLLQGILLSFIAASRAFLNNFFEAHLQCCILFETVPYGGNQ